MPARTLRVLQKRNRADNTIPCCHPHLLQLLRVHAASVGCVPRTCLKESARFILDVQDKSWTPYNICM